MDVSIHEKLAQDREENFPLPEAFKEKVIGWKGEVATVNYVN